MLVVFYLVVVREGVGVGEGGSSDGGVVWIKIAVSLHHRGVLSNSHMISCKRSKGKGLRKTKTLCYMYASIYLYIYIYSKKGE